MKQTIFTALVVIGTALYPVQKKHSSYPYKKAGIRCLMICLKVLLKKIKALQNQPKQNPAASVYQYQYAGTTVYYFTADCCDQYNYLYDSKCAVVCAPDGGITGHGDGRYNDFYEKATGQKLIWHDLR